MKGSPLTFKDAEIAPLPHSEQLPVRFWFFLSVLSVTVIGLSLVYTGKGEIGLPLGLFAMIVGFCALPFLFSFRSDQLVSLIFFLALALDVPAAPAYYFFEPFTEILGGILLFNTIGKTLGIPGISVLPLDVITYAYLFIAIAVYFPKLKEIGLKVNERSLIVRTALIFLGAIMFSLIFGRIKGHDSYLTFLQVRFLFYIPAWFIIGFMIFTKLEQATKLLDLLVLAMLFKSCVALYAYFSEIRHYPMAEYLVDHHMSIFWSMAIITVFCRAFLWNDQLLGKVLGGILLGIMAYPYILNDRRTSFLGLGFTFAFMVVILKGAQLRKYLKMLLLGFPIYLIVVSKHFVENSDKNLVDYRDLENFNLYHLISQNPLFGIGFGKRFEMIAEMPDISRFYPLFDLIPHNTMLALWGYAGPFAMAALAAMITIGMMSSVYLVRQAPSWKTQIFGLSVVALVVQWLLFMFADLGLVEIRSSSLSMAMLGMSLGLSFRLRRQLANLPDHGHGHHNDDGTKYRGLEAQGGKPIYEQNHRALDAHELHHTGDYSRAI